MPDRPLSVCLVVPYDLAEDGGVGNVPAQGAANTMALRLSPRTARVATFHMYAEKAPNRRWAAEFDWGAGAGRGRGEYLAALASPAALRGHGNGNGRGRAR